MRWETSPARLEGHLHPGDRLEIGLVRALHPLGAAAGPGDGLLPRRACAGGRALPLAGRRRAGVHVGGRGARAHPGDFQTAIDTEGMTNGG